MDLFKELWRDNIKPFVQKPLGKISLFFLYYLYFIHVPVIFLYNSQPKFMLLSQKSCFPNEDLEVLFLFQGCTSFEIYLKSGFYLSIILLVPLYMIATVYIMVYIMISPFYFLFIVIPFFVKKIRQWIKDEQ